MERPRLAALAALLSAWVLTASPARGAGTGAEPAQLFVWNRPIVELRASPGGVTPAQRVERIERRVSELPPAALTGEIVAEPTTLAGEQGLLVTAAGHPILFVLPGDVDHESGQTVDDVGRQVIDNLRGALRARAEQRDVGGVLRHAALAIVATILLALVLLIVARMRRAALARIRGAAVRRLVLLQLDVWPILTGLNSALVKLTALAAWAVAAYVWLAFVLVQFPYTQPWGERLGGYIRGLLAQLAAGAVAGIPGLFAVLLVFLLARIVTRGAGALFDGVASGRLVVPWLEPDTARATRRLVVAVIWIFAITVAYPYVPGSETGVFKGVSVFVGLMITLGSTGYVNQVMSGLVVVYSRAVRPGDWIRMGETEGLVSQVGLLSTKLTNLRHEEITIPHAVLISTPVTNYTRLAGSNGAVVATTVTIGYDAPWRQVHALLERAAAATAGIRSDPPPRVYQRALSDFYAEYQLAAHLDRDDARVEVLSRLHAAIQDSFNEAGVQIMSPNFVEQPERAVVVPPERWYEPPAAPPEGAKKPPSRSGTGP
jgi:small-conductance mechanosensitive channel